MEEIKVKKDVLLNALKKNRDQHVEDFKLAVEGYKMAVKKALSKKSREVKDLTPENIKDFSIYISEQAPQSHKKQFDEVIGMLALSVDDEIFISPSEYRHYYLNDWDWKETWNVSNSFYMAMAKTAKSKRNK
jgi:hypothetical protein